MSLRMMVASLKVATEQVKETSTGLRKLREETEATISKHEEWMAKAKAAEPAWDQYVDKLSELGQRYLDTKNVFERDFLSRELDTALRIMRELGIEISKQQLLSNLRNKNKGSVVQGTSGKSSQQGGSYSSGTSTGRF